MFFGVLSIMSCATAVNDFLGVLCATFFSRPYFLVSISMLRQFRVLCYDHFRVSQCFVMITFHWFVGLITNFHETILI